jgi:hypothetical protein
MTLYLVTAAGCTAMMVGGGATYEPPADECGGNNQNDRDCKK